MPIYLLSNKQHEMTDETRSKFKLKLAMFLGRPEDESLQLSLSSPPAESAVDGGATPGSPTVEDRA
jgi:hypothetical protein